MRNKAGKKFLLPLLGLSLALGSSLVFANTQKKAEQVEGYSTSSLPTTIDLNDTSASAIRSYYSSLNSLGTAQRQGTNLLKNLKTILKNGQKYYSYDSGSAIWQIYEISDRDWSKSPASSTTYGTYNSSTNKITGYTYGTGSGSSAKNNPYIHALYINRDVTNQTTAWDDHQQTQWGINREHVWPKAEGFETSGAGGARGDPMHLMAGNGYANNIHSNYYYGYVNTSSSYTNCGTKYSNTSGNLLGKSKTLGGSTNVFEPQDSDKGDIARAIFYMVARYNYLSGSDSDGIDSNNPNLTLTQSLSDWASSGYSSTTSKTGKMGILTDLLNWHHQDPVDEYEIHRNNLLYTNYTNNRNPFIDFPEWADFIWGTAVYNGKTYSSYSSTPTGYATPSSDTINGYNSGSTDPVSVTGVTLDDETVSIEVGESEVLSYSISPSNATNQAVTWTSSDTSVATASSSGRVEGVSEGTATITIRTSDGNFTDTCSVTVTAASGSSEGTVEGTSDLSSATTNTGDSAWDITGASGYYSSNNGVKLDATNEYIIKNPIFSGVASTYMTSLDVTINARINTSGGASPGSSNAYKVEAIDSSGTVLATETKTGSDVFTTSFGDTTFSLNSNLSGCTGIKITFSNKETGNWSVKSVSWTATYEVPEEEITLSSIAVKTAPSKTTYTAGDDFSPSGLVITATYSDATTVDIAYDNNPDSFEFDPADNLQTSDTSVTISYGGKTCTQAITVNAEKTLSSISLNTDNVTKTFYVGDTFEHNNLVVTAHYSDSSSEVVSSSSTVSTPNMSTAGEKTVTLSYTYGGTTQSASYTITVIESGSAVPGNYTWNLSVDSTSSASDTNLTWIANCATMSADKYESSTATNNYYPGTSGKTYTSTRFYKNSKLTFTPNTNYEITSVVFTATQESYATELANSTWTNATASASSSTVTVTPTDGNTAFYAIISGTNGHTSVVVNYLETPTATLSSITLDTTNVQTTFAVNDTFTYSGLVVTAHYSDSSSAVVTPTSVSSPNMSTTGQKEVTVTYEEDDVTKTASYTITVNSNPTLNWTAPAINTYSGTSLTSTQANTWGVTYNNGSGSTTNPTYGQFSVKLGGTTISLPYTWQPGDDGKTLCVSYSSLTTNTTTVSIVQSLNLVSQHTDAYSAFEPATSISAGDTVYLVTAVSKNELAGISTTSTKYGTLASYSTTPNKVYPLTVGAGSSSGSYSFANSNGSYLYWNSGNSLNVNATLSANTSWTVEFDENGNATILSKADSTRQISYNARSGQERFATYASPAIDDTGSNNHNVQLWKQVSHAAGDTQYSNIAGHEDAQRAVVKFAKAFNTAMDTTSMCTTNMSSAWSSATSAWSTFLSEAGALGETEEAYAKSLIQYATAQWTTGTDSDYSYCLERALATYEYCVANHGQTAFMSAVRSVSVNPKINPLSLFTNKGSNTIAVITIISLVSVTAIGGYFFLRKRKEQE